MELNSASSKNSRVAFWCLLFILFLLPIPLGANRPWAWSFFELCIFVLTFFSSLTGAKQTFVGMRQHSTILCLWGSFIVLSCLQIVPLPEEIITLLSPHSAEAFSKANADQMFLSVDPGQSQIHFIKLLSLFCLFLLILQLVNTEKRLKQLFLTLLAAGALQAVYGSLEILLGVDTSVVFGFSVDNRASGSFVYHNHFANFLVLSLSAGIGLVVASLENEKLTSARSVIRSFANYMLGSKALIRISIIFMVIALVMSRSRMGNIAFFIAVAIMGALALLIMTKRSRGLTILIVSMFVIDLLIVSAYFGLDKVKQRIETTDFTQESRDEVLEDAVPLLQDFAVFGSGGGSFYGVFPQYQKADVIDFYDHLHNDYIQFAIEYGVFGVSILGMIVGLSLFNALWAMRKRRSALTKGTAFGCAMAFIGMLIHMSVDFPLQAYANACYFVTLIGVSVVLRTIMDARNKQDTTDLEPLSKKKV